MIKIRYVRSFFLENDDQPPRVSSLELSPVPYPELPDSNYTLTVRFKVSNGRFSCGHERAAPRFEIDSKPSGIYFHYIHKGKGSYNGQPFHAGDIFVTRPTSKKLICADAKEPYELFWCVWKGELAKTMENKMTKYENDRLYHLDEDFHLNDLFRYMIYNFHRQSKSDYVVKSFSDLLLADCHLVEREQPSENTRINETIEAIRQYVDQNYRTATVEEIARLFHYNRRYLSSAFREQTGVTIQDLIRDAKLRHAEEYLFEKKMSMEDIAIACGYTSYSAFIKAFEKQYDVTPSEFIRLYTEL